MIHAILDQAITVKHVVNYDDSNKPVYGYTQVSRFSSLTGINRDYRGMEDYYDRLGLELAKM